MYAAGEGWDTVFVAGKEEWPRINKWNNSWKGKQIKGTREITEQISKIPPQISEIRNIHVYLTENKHQNFTRLTYSNLAFLLTQQYHSGFLHLKLTVGRVCYPHWNAWLITPRLYNTVHVGKCPHSFYRRYVPVTLKEKLLEALWKHNGSYNW